MGKQDFGNLQTRKMKGLKRTRGEIDGDDETLLDEEDMEEGTSPKRERR